jgi:hypothetical protein
MRRGLLNPVGHERVERVEHKPRASAATAASLHQSSHGIFATATTPAATRMVKVGSMPVGMRVIVCEECPRPAAQLRFTGIDGHRFTCFATDARTGQLADLDLRHRRRAGVRTGSGTRRTPACAASPGTASPRTRSGASW